MRHGAFRIEPRRCLKRTNRFAVVKAVIKGESLIEITLRLWRIGRDFAFVGAKPFEERLLRPNYVRAREYKRQREHNPA